MFQNHLPTEHGIFVYGTLRPGSYNAPMLSGAEVTPAHLVGARLHYPALHEHYPCLVITDDCEDVVYGDYFEVAPADVPFVVDMELGAGYNMDLCRVVLDDGTRVDAWVFSWDRAVGRRIDSGDFLLDVATRKA